MEGISFLLLLWLFLALYMLPTITAWNRAKDNLPAIFFFNLFLGWTFIGWVLAFVWAFLKDKKYSSL